MNNQQQQMVHAFRGIAMHRGVKRPADGQHDQEPPQKRRKLDHPSQVPSQVPPQVPQAPANPQSQRQEEPMDID